MTATIETDEGIQVEQQDWYGTARLLGPDDGHERDGDPLDVIVTRDNETGAGTRAHGMR